MMNFTIYTILTNDYYPGFIALVNSLRANGFNEKIIVGVDKTFNKKDSIDNVEFVEVEYKNYWIGNLKPYLLLNYPNENFIFIDSDIIINHEKFRKRLEKIVKLGFFLTIENILPANDYRRFLWNKNNDYGSHDYYYNSGLFAGSWKRDREIIDKWWNVISENIEPPGDIYENEIYPMPDQDSLNSVLQKNEAKLVTMTYPDVWFTTYPVKPFIHVGGFDRPAILHCTGKNKTWKIKNIPNYSPNIYDLKWYKYVILHNKIGIGQVPISYPLKLWFEKNPIITIYQKLLKLLS